MRDRILELLRQRPFQAFRLHLSNGIVHVVRHPEQAILGPSYIVIGITVGDAPGPEVVDTAFVSLIHVVEVDLLATAPTASN
jgi:hypothetical protein